MRSVTTRFTKSVNLPGSAPTATKSGSEISRRNRRSKARGTSNERSLAKELQKAGHVEARRVIGSGKYSTHKGDIELRKADTLLEAKVYQVTVDARGHRYVAVDLEWVPKAEKEAGDMHFEHSAVIVRPKGSSEWVAVLSKKEYLKYLDYCKS